MMLQSDGKLTKGGHTLITIYKTIYKIIYGYAKWVLAAVILIVFAQVVSRNIFRSNIRWSQEISLLLIIWMAFLGIAIGADKKLHIAVEVFYVRFPRVVQRIIDVLIHLIVISVGLVFLFYGVRLMMFTKKSFLPVTKWSGALMYLTIPISGLCLIYFEILDMVGLRTFKEAATDDVQTNDVTSLGIPVNEGDK